MTSADTILVGRLEDPETGRALVASIVGESKLVRLTATDAEGNERRVLEIKGPKLRALIVLLEMADAARKPRPTPATLATPRPTWGNQ